MCSLPLFLSFLVSLTFGQSVYYLQHTYNGVACDGVPTDTVIIDGTCPTTAACTPGATTSTKTACGVAQAVVNIISAAPSTDPALKGTITFVVTNSTTVRVTVDVTGITTNPNGMHGIHVHQFGDLSGFLPLAAATLTGANGVGSHWNPLGNNHSCEIQPGHGGDLGNWTAVGGAINDFKDIHDMNLTGVRSIIGHAVVVHALADDCVNTTSAGGRLGVGVIGIANVVSNLATADPALIGNAVCVFTGTQSLETQGITNSGAAFITGPPSPFRVTAWANVTATYEKPLGFHIHQWGDLTNPDGTGAGGHWNPGAALHGLPTVDSNRHAGDLGNIQTFNAASPGVGFYDYAPTFQNNAFFTIHQMIGHAMVVHLDVDHGNDPSCPGGNTTGAAGPRGLYCVIGIINPAIFPGQVSAVPPSITVNNTFAQIPCAAVTPVTTPSPTPATPTPGQTPTPGVTPTPAETPVSPPVSDGIIIPARAGMYPENFAWDPNAKKFILGSIGVGDISHVDQDGAVTMVVPPEGRAYNFPTLGMLTVENRLYACHADFSAVQGTPSSSVIAFDITSVPFIEVWRVDLDRVGSLVSYPRRGCNDFEVDNNGYLYVTDAFASIVYRINTKDGSGAEIWSESDLYVGGSFTLDGIVFIDNFLVVGQLSNSQFFKIGINETDGSAEDPILINFAVGVNIPNAPDGLTYLNGRILVSHSAGLVAISSSDKYETFDWSSEVFPTTYPAVASTYGDFGDKTYYILTCNISNVDPTASPYEIVPVTDEAILGTGGSNNGWIAAVVILLLVAFIVACAIIFLMMTNEKKEYA